MPTNNARGFVRGSKNEDLQVSTNSDHLPTRAVSDTLGAVSASPKDTRVVKQIFRVSPKGTVLLERQTTSGTSSKRSTTVHSVGTSASKRPASLTAFRVDIENGPSTVGSPIQPRSAPALGAGSNQTPFLAQSPESKIEASKRVSKGAWAALSELASTSSLPTDRSCDTSDVRFSNYFDPAALTNSPSKPRATSDSPSKPEQNSDRCSARTWQTEKLGHSQRALGELPPDVRLGLLLKEVRTASQVFEDSQASAEKELSILLHKLRTSQEEHAGKRTQGLKSTTAVENPENLWCSSPTESTV
jgi:hypothetical protein